MCVEGGSAKKIPSTADEQANYKRHFAAHPGNDIAMQGKLPKDLEGTFGAPFLFANRFFPSQKYPCFENNNKKAAFVFKSRLLF